ncbi:MAG: monovalent cation/H(+) antiporter subunit G [Desulfurivibrionaceae bacterium]
MLLNILVILLIVFGLCFFLATTVGLLRFPDFYTRMHATGKGDTISSLLILLGLALYNLQHLSVASLLVSIKILMILFFLFMASPTATHAIIDAGYQSGIAPWQNEEDGEEGK